MKKYQGAKRPLTQIAPSPPHGAAAPIVKESQPSAFCCLLLLLLFGLMFARKRDLPRVDCTSLMSTLHPCCLTPFTLRWISYDWLNGCCMASADSPRRDEFTASPYWKQLIFNSHLILHRQRLMLKVPL
jgi:hypothetical protein